jgi:hypothetical protein
MSSVIAVNGVALDFADHDLAALPVRCCVYARDGEPWMEIQRRGIAPPSPDTWLGKPVTWTYSGTLYFAGDVVTREASFDRIGLVFTYRCRGLYYRGNLVAITDDSTLTDTLRFNQQGDDPDYNAARAGRNVGQIITTLLTQGAVAAGLSARGIGNYTTLSPPTLPSATVTDLAALTWVPPAPVTIQGEHVLSSLAALLGDLAPNHALHVEPGGTIRILDTRTFAANTLTAGVDPIMPGLPRIDVSGCYSRVQLRGAPWVEPVEASLSNGLLAEWFDHDGLSNSAAIAAWTLYNFERLGGAIVTGTCVCPSTTQCTVDPTDNTVFWSSNFWDQTSTGAHGAIYLRASSLGGSINQLTSRRIVSNAALTAGGTSTLTLDTPLPSTLYNFFTIQGLQASSSIVYRKYKVTNTPVGNAMQRHFSWPVNWHSANGLAEASTTAPVASVVYGTGAPYSEQTVGFTFDPSGPYIMLEKPSVYYSESDTTKLYAGSGYATPVDVRALLAVAKGELSAVYPPDSGGSPVYSGGAHTTYGIDRTYIVTMPAWRDPSNAAGMAAFVQELWAAVSEPVVEGGLTYIGLWTPALTFGQALTIAGDGYTTGYEGLSLPIVECEVSWTQGTGEGFVTSLALSNRRGAFSGEMFIRPPMTGLSLGLQGGEETPFSALGGPRGLGPEGG